MPETQVGTLQYASSVEVGATTRASARADRRGNDRAAGETTRAGDSQRIPIAGQHSTGPPGPLTIRRYQNTCCDPSVGYGSSSRAARRAAEGPTQGVLVFTPSSHQEAKPREALDKATYAKGRKPHPFSLGQLPEEQATNAPATCFPPDNSHGVLDNTVSELSSVYIHSPRSPR
ncbi:hypothetical protein MTO96_041051 [Rhipicephalus appendiculatus]